MPRYRRIPLTREKSLQAALTSVVVGAGAAAVTYVFARLMLSRDPLTRGELRAASSVAGALGPGEATPAVESAVEADAEDE